MVEEIELILLNDCDSINLYKEEEKRLLKKKKKIDLIINPLLEVRTISNAEQQNNTHRKIWTFKRSNRFFEKELFENGQDFFKENMRMSQESFQQLCSLLPNLTKLDMPFRETIPLEKRIAVAVYALGSSAGYRTVANVFGIGCSTVSNIVLEFCNEVWKKLKPLYLNSYPLTDVVIKENMIGFEALGFPQCIGAIDGCHIQVKPTRNDAADYCNYKGWYSTVMLAVVDHKLNFMYINVGCPGKCNDSTIFEDSRLKKQHGRKNELLRQNTIIIENTEIPPLLVADSAFKLTKYVMKPYPFKIEASYEEKNFNYRLSKCRRVVENAFGHLKARFRRLGKGIDNKINNVNMIIKACCVLNNFLNSRRDEVNLMWMQQQKEHDRTRPQPLFEMPENHNDGIAIRNAIKKHFSKCTL